MDFAGEVGDGGDGVFAEEGADEGGVGDVASDAGDGWGEWGGWAAGGVVEDEDVAAGFVGGPDEVGADKAEAACDEEGHEGGEDKGNGAGWEGKSGWVTGQQQTAMRYWEVG